MKRILGFILLIGLAIISLNQTTIEAVNFSYKTVEVDIVEYDGTINTNRLVDISYKAETRSRFNVLEFDNSDDNIHLVTISDYTDFKWGMRPLEGMIYNYELENPNVEVLGGINGDFYDINDTGQPSATFIQNFEVIKGVSSRPLFLINDDDTYEIIEPRNKPITLQGYELLIIDKNNEIKFRETFSNVNQLSNAENQVSVLLHTFDGNISPSLNPVIIEAEDIKYNKTPTLERAKGYANLNSETLAVTNRQFIVLGKGIENIITEDDLVLVQRKIAGFENVRGAMGGSDVIVENGLVSNFSSPRMDLAQRAPRTLVGIKEDGSVFFVVSNGRDEAGENVPGLTMEESGNIMKSLGAHYAINLDGGGSSTLMARNFDGTFATLNKLSDGHMRSVSNGILIVRGDVPEKPIPVIKEDTRTNFAIPANIFIDYNNNIRFSTVEGATRYIVIINGTSYETSRSSFSLKNLKPGEYSIKVKTKSNFNGKASNESLEITYKVKEETTNKLIDWVAKLAKNKN